MWSFSFLIDIGDLFLMFVLNQLCFSINFLYRFLFCTCFHFASFSFSSLNLLYVKLVSNDISAEFFNNFCLFLLCFFSSLNPFCSWILRTYCKNFSWLFQVDQASWGFLCRLLVFTELIRLAKWSNENKNLLFICMLL
jgi:hypothetical protein